jgi:L-amino acid N-acyltransferase YncA/ribosomal protein S27E
LGLPITGGWRAIFAVAMLGSRRYKHCKVNELAARGWGGLMQRAIDPNQLGEDWLGNNIAVTCPLCRKVFVVSAHLNRGGRKCPNCGKSTALVSGGKDSNGTATIQVDELTMTDAEAQQVATLINGRNQLARLYEPADILREAPHYEYESRDGKVVACVERREVQWYQWEVLHLSVAEAWEGKGLASLVYERLEHAARSAGVRILQCTIREGNKESVGFFDKRGFSKVARFLNRQTGNAVGVWQKVLVEPRPDGRAKSPQETVE